MWPVLLDMTEEESMQTLRSLELEAYAGLVTALRAQGPLNAEKLKLLRDSSYALNISHERHRAEVRRAVNDEKLNTIAYHSMSGGKLTCDEWAQEGRRVVPLMARVAPQTVYAAVADEIADTASKNNKQLPSPASTERITSAPVFTQTNVSDGKISQYRISETPKCDEPRKRKLSIPVEYSTLAQHLMGPPKMSRIQQIYRQKTKARLKEQEQIKQEQEKRDVEMQQQVLAQQFQQQIQLILQKLPTGQQNTQFSSPKLTASLSQEDNSELKVEPNSSTIPKAVDLSPRPGCSNENQSPKIKPIAAIPIAAIPITVDLSKLSPKLGCYYENQAPKTQPGAAIPIAVELSNLSPKPGCSNENQAPKTKPVTAFPIAADLSNLSPKPGCSNENQAPKTKPDAAFPIAVDLGNLSPKPDCLNENQAPKTKPVVAFPKAVDLGNSSKPGFSYGNQSPKANPVAANTANQHITLKHITSSAGSSGEKQVKMCTTRKTITTKNLISGQKLIVVSNPQTITTSSILQRTLTIPFVKNISVKNLDKFKIVTTNNASSIQLTPLTTTTAFSGTPLKHKIVTVRPNSTVKKVIPISQLQVLNAKGGIKVLPIGGKIVTKTTINTGSAPVYIVNSSSMKCLTKSTNSTPIIMTCKAQDDTKPLLILESMEIPVGTDSTDRQTGRTDVNMNAKDTSGKSNVSADMQAVGVVNMNVEDTAGKSNVSADMQAVRVVNMNAKDFSGKSNVSADMQAVGVVNMYAEGTAGKPNVLAGMQYGVVNINAEDTSGKSNISADMQAVGIVNMYIEDSAGKSYVLADMQTVVVDSSTTVKDMDIENEIVQHTIKECMHQVQMVADQSVPLSKKEINLGNESLFQALETEDNVVAPSNGDTYDTAEEQPTLVTDAIREELNTVDNLEPFKGFLSAYEDGDGKVELKD